MSDEMDEASEEEFHDRMQRLIKYHGDDLPENPTEEYVRIVLKHIQELEISAGLFDGLEDGSIVIGGVDEKGEVLFKISEIGQAMVDHGFSKKEDLN